MQLFFKATTTSTSTAKASTTSAQPIIKLNNTTEKPNSFIKEIIKKSLRNDKIELLFYLFGSFHFIVLFLHSMFVLPLFKYYLTWLCRCNRGTQSARNQRKQPSPQQPPPHKRLFKSLSLPVIVDSTSSSSMLYFIQKCINVHTWLCLLMAFVYGGLMGNFFTLMNHYLGSRVTSDFAYQVELIYKLFILSFLLPRFIRLCCCNDEPDQRINNQININTANGSNSSSTSIKRITFIWIIRQNIKMYLITFKLTLLTAYQFSSSHFKDN